MVAEIVPSYPPHPEDEVGSIHIECRGCRIEWGWARNVPSAFNRLARMADDHNIQVHGHRRIRT